MIIKNFKKNSIYFWKNSFKIESDEKNTTLDLNINDEDYKKIKTELNNKKIINSENLNSLREKLNFLNDNDYAKLEDHIFECMKKPWKLLTEKPTQIPRPMSIIFSKDLGVKEFLIFSTTSQHFDAALNANNQVTGEVNKRLVNEDRKTISDEKLFIIIKEGIDEVFKDLNFDLRLGIRLDNHSNGKYLYNGKELNGAEQLEYVKTMIETYGLIYVENPFYENEIELYKKLSEEVRHKCLVCINSKINEYSRQVKERAFNTALLKLNSITQFENDSKTLKENNINILSDSDTKADVLAGLGIPLVKIYNNSEGNKFAERIKIIERELTEK
ncbi:MAG: hypothetical protein AABX19_01160 [Nanoarchaeota archaeon]